MKNLCFLPWLLLGSSLLFHCGPPMNSQNSGQDASADGVANQPTQGCGSVRLTAYSASNSGWCEFNRNQNFLPDFVRQGLTLAIAEPYNGSSYGGAPGESCGECWEIDTITDTRVVMVHDLCPIQGNPLCAGGHFHFDLASEAGQVLRAGGLDEAVARRVACPVTGNVHLQINDRNQYGYLRFAVINHRVPVRSVEYQRGGTTTWRAAQRSGGAWHVVEDNQTFASTGPGGVFRLTSAQGQQVEMPNRLMYSVPNGSSFDLGAQFTDQSPAVGPACVYVPPATVYSDQYGGIDQVRWQINPWGNASASEVTSDCRNNSQSCIRVNRVGSASGFHIYYRQAFPTSTFSRLSLWVRAVSTPGNIIIAPSNDGTRCQATMVSLTQTWTEVSIALNSVCGNLSELNALTVDGPNSVDILLDDIRWVQ